MNVIQISIIHDNNNSFTQKKRPYKVSKVKIKIKNKKNLITKNIIF